jgi:MarR family transcriptional regulator, organic hydroperoxide resistance regulator
VTAADAGRGAHWLLAATREYWLVQQNYIPWNLFRSMVRPVDVDVVGLFRDLVRLETELWNRVEARVQHTHGVPLAWLEIMQVVGNTEGCRVLDIARVLSITVGGASKVVDKVEAAGWCRRQPNPTDGRSNLIELTGPGEGLLEAANVTFATAVAAYVRTGASAGELAQLSVTLRRLRQHLMTPEPAELATRP